MVCFVVFLEDGGLLSESCLLAKVGSDLLGRMKKLRE